MKIMIVFGYSNNLQAYFWQIKVKHNTVQIKYICKTVYTPIYTQ